MLAAPGADDNATSVAALLESARVIMEMGYQPRQTMIFLATAAEELNSVGGSGSRHYAETAAANGRDLAMTINSDMIGWNDSSRTVSLVVDDNSQCITDMAVHIIDTYTTLAHNFTSFGTFCDLKYFLYQGYEGIFFIENVAESWSPFYHTVNDLSDHIDTAYHAEMSRAILGNFLFSDMLTTDAAIVNIDHVPEGNCNGILSPVITIANYGADTLFYLDIVCRVNEGDSIVVPWTGTLAFRQEQQVGLPQLIFNILPENELWIALENINGETDQIPLNNAMSIDFVKAQATPSEVMLKILLDSHPEETTWDVRNSSGEVLFSGGPYSSPGSMIEVSMEFDDPGCYCANFYDSAGNGLQLGFFILYYGNNNIIATVLNFESMTQVQFDVQETTAIDETAGSEELVFYPNPGTGLFFIRSVPESSFLSIYNSLGKPVVRNIPLDRDPFEVFLEAEVPGIYFYEIRSRNKTHEGRFIITGM